MRIFHNEISRVYWRSIANERFQEMAAADAVLRALGHCPAYTATPLVGIDKLASTLGIRKMSVKDETDRMGLGSFKALGGAYAVFDYLLNKSPHSQHASSDTLIKSLSDAAAGSTFCCASAGNHGLSVAAGARLFGAQCTVFLAAPVPEAFAERLREFGAAVVRCGEGYDDSMAGALKAAQENNWVLIADSSWDGYLDVPSMVMQGYAVIGDEVLNACNETGDWPSHVFLQAGVGGLAGALANHIRLTWLQQPAIIVVEPENAACLMESMRNDRMTRVPAPGTNMGRLDCAEPSLLAYEILKETADSFVTVSDQSAAAAAQTLTSAGVATTPSGAAGFAALNELASHPQEKQMTGLDEAAHCLVFATETSL
ncbi:diaminopropionate ammonia-lyase [Hyphomonas sp. UBA4494]|uniref:diaminopropionate ammonia-lyase n=1 Tax=Hyphomonas sp. UBA4494 TaxID=1946631 RepID=UPI0025BA513C|nr:diaminopropionate ammonia-lyase [Hyphomonas sp. UBA4494]